MALTKEEHRARWLADNAARLKAETDAIKSDINLRDFAVVHCGYQIDKKGSTATSFVLRRNRNNAVQGSGDKITVEKKGNVWLYCNQRNTAEGGTIIEFANRHYPPCIGIKNTEAIRELKKFLGIQIQSQAPSINSGNSKPVESVKITTAEAAQTWKSFTPVAPDNEYLTQDRQLTPKTVAAFAKAMATNQAGEICFPLREILNEDGQVRVGNLRGWIRKNTRNPSQDGNICKGGTRGIWIHRPSPPEKGSKIQTRTILFEAPIDAMSYFELYGQTGDRYIATAGNFIDAHRTFLGAKEFPRENFFVATDNDAAGEQFYRQIKEIIPTAQRLRSYSKDYNQDLKDCKNADLSEYLMAGYSSPSSLSDLDSAFEIALDLDDFTTARKIENEFEAEEEDELAIPF